MSTVVRLLWRGEWRVATRKMATQSEGYHEVEMSADADADAAGGGNGNENENDDVEKRLDDSGGDPAEKQKQKQEQEQEQEQEQSKESTGRILLTIFIASCMGTIFGMLFQKSRVFEPWGIRGQFTLRRWVMLKMFFGAVGGSGLLFSVLSVVSPEKFSAMRDLFRSACERGILSGAAGGAVILGAGMATGGACPGMVLAQVGSGVTNSWLTVIGGLLGCIVYGFAEPSIRERIVKAGPILNKDKRFVDEMVTKLNGSATVLMAAVGICMLGATGLVEALVPWEGELDVPNSAECSMSNPFACRAWNPGLCGFLLSLLQIPTFFSFGTALGSATAYQSVCSVPLIPFEQKALVKKYPILSYMSIFTPNRSATIWQVFYCGMAMCGAYIGATTTAVASFGTTASVPALDSFLGGFLMLFGSRMAAGCTSGHGISGCPMLLIHSWVAVPAMFGSGIIVGLAWDAAVGCPAIPTMTSGCFAGPHIGSWFSA